MTDTLAVAQQLALRQGDHVLLALPYLQDLPDLWVAAEVLAADARRVAARCRVSVTGDQATNAPPSVIQELEVVQLHLVRGVGTPEHLELQRAMMAAATDELRREFDEGLARCNQARARYEQVLEFHVGTLARDGADA